MSIERRRGRVAAAFAGLGLAAAGTFGLGACAGILGLEDRTVDTDGATNVSGSVTTTSTSTGTGSNQSSSSVMSSGSVASTSSSASKGSIDVDAADEGGRVIETDATLDGPPADVNLPEAATTCAATGNCTIATGLNFPWVIAADEQRIYWVEAGTSPSTSDGAVKSCPLTGCGAGPLVYAAGINFPRDLVVDATNVYWETFTPSATGGGGIWSCPVTGCVGAPRQIASVTQPYGLAVDATYVYWVDQFDWSVHRSLKAGGGADLVLDDGGTSSNHTSPMFATVDNSFVYFTDDTGGVYALPFDGGVARWVLNNDTGNNDYGIAVDSTNLYFGAENSFAATGSALDFVYRVDKRTASPPPATPPQTALASNLNWAFSVTLDPDGGNVFFADYGGGVGTRNAQVGRVSTSGGAVHYYAQGLPTAEWVSATSAYVFWATFAERDSSGTLIPFTGTITRAAK
jgi:hypothetical protein